MTTLDSIKVQAPLEVLDSVNTNLFDHVHRTKAGIPVQDKHEATRIGLGLNKIELNHLTETVTIQTSAKVLKRDYAKGINIDTIEQVIESIPSNLIELNVGRFMDSAELLTVDVTDNIQTDFSSAEIVNGLSLLPVPAKYEVTAYNTPRNTGLVFKGKQKTFKERQIFYDKNLDIKFNKLNKELREQVNPEHLYESFKGSIRVETNLTQFRTIEKYLGSRHLKTVLESPTKTNYDVLSKITRQSSIQVQSLFQDFEGMSIRSIIRHEGIKGIIEKSGRDWTYIDRWLKSVSPSNHRKYRKEFRSVYNTMQESKGRHVSIVNLLLDKLKAA